MEFWLLDRVAGMKKEHDRQERGRFVAMGFDTKQAYDECMVMGFTTKHDYDKCMAMGLETKEDYDKCVSMGFDTKQEYEICVALGFDTKHEYDAFIAAGFQYSEAKQQRSSFSWKGDHQLGDRVLHKGRICFVVSRPDSAGFCRVFYNDTGEESGFLKAGDLLAVHPARIAFDKYIEMNFANKQAYDKCVAMGFDSKEDYERCVSMGFDTKQEYEDLSEKCISMGFDTKQDYDKCLAMGFETKQEYEEFMRSVWGDTWNYA